MAFDTFDVAIQLIHALREVIAKLSTQDADLAGQLRRAAASVPLNITEGRKRIGKDRMHHWRIAAGSAAEVVACLRIAEAWQQLDAEQILPALGFADRVLAMLWKLTH